MENKINIAELLKDCPKGMELDSTIYNGVVTLEGVADCLDRCIYPIKIKVKCDDETFTNVHTLTEYGQITPSPCDKCVIFPKGKITWEGFRRPFNDGDVVTSKLKGSEMVATIIYKERVEDTPLFKCHFVLYDNMGICTGICKNVYLELDEGELRFATEEEKEKIFEAIEERGYRWDTETKTLEKVIESKEETDEETKATKDQDYSINRRVYFSIPDGYEFECIENNEIILKLKQPVYPKTYEECCEVLVGRKPNPNEIPFDEMELCLVDSDNTQNIEFQNQYLFQLNYLFRLLMCRDAYWRIAGEQMGLGKPWEPDWSNHDTVKYCIIIDSNIISRQTNRNRQFTLSFPMREMRDAFYENFKDFIEKCKELL